MLATTTVCSRNDRNLRSGAVLALALILSLTAFAAGPPSGVSNDEWTSIQAQIEAERHTITESEHPGRLYRADNPNQRFTAHFGAEDVLITPRGGGEPDWQLGLRLTAWGSADNLQPVHPGSAIAEGNRVEFRRGPLTEWYVNTNMGLEQGFTINAPPDDDIIELVLEMTLDGNLTAELAENAQAVTFRQEGSNATLTYSGVAAWDAVDAPLEARMELGGRGATLRLVVGVADSAWPITVDPVFTQVAELLPTPHLDTTDAFFGRCVDVDSETMIVGMNDWVHGEYSGAAHIFMRDPSQSGEWNHVKKLEAPSGAPFDSFGASVSISGDTAVVGVWGADDNGVDSGSAYVFGRDQGGDNAWGLVKKLSGSDTNSYDHFGVSVAIDDSTIAIGSTGNGVGATYIFGKDHGGPTTWGQMAKIRAAGGEDGDAFGQSVAIGGDLLVVGAPSDDDNGSYSGSAYVFERDSGGSDSWGQTAKLTASDGGSMHRFGFSVSVHHDVAVVGAPLYDYYGANTGSAYVFQRDHGGTGAWGEVTKLTAPDPDGYDYFGHSVAISESTVLIGAYGDYGSTGAAYLYRKDQGGLDAWGHIATLTADVGYFSYEFGRSVSINGGTVVIGEPERGPGRAVVFQEDNGGPNVWGQEATIPCQPVYTADHDHFGESVSISGDTAVVGTPSDDEPIGSSGSAYVFRRVAGESVIWEKVAKLTAGDPNGDRFGFGVAADGNTIVVGAPSDDHAGSHTGSAYVFERDFGGTGSWGQVAKIIASDGEAYDQFGWSVSVSGDTTVIGAVSDDANGQYSGSAYVFQRDHGGTDAWGEIAKITPADGEAEDWFGNSVSISGDTAAIGAFADDDFSYNSGAAYVFQRDQGGPDSWGQIAKISNPDGGQFGRSVSIENDTLIAGSPHDLFGFGGAAYVFRRDHGGPNLWGLVSRIEPADGSLNFRFGWSVSICNEHAFVGANPNDVVSSEFGSAYIFHRSQGGPDGWGQVGKIISPSGVLDDDFGKSVALCGGTAIVGAPMSGILSVEAGAAFVYDVGAAFFTDGFETGDTSGWSATVP